MLFPSVLLAGVIVQKLRNLFLAEAGNFSFHHRRTQVFTGWDVLDGCSQVRRPLAGQPGAAPRELAALLVTGFAACRVQCLAGRSQGRVKFRLAGTKTCFPYQSATAVMSSALSWLEILHISVFVPALSPVL